MNFENVFFAVICWLCSLIFGAIALWAYRRRDPMHFWSGSTVKPEEIEDIPGYNRANGLMWAIYAFCMFAAGALSLISITVGVILIVTLSFPGLIVLIIVYQRIYNKYKGNSTAYPMSGQTSKPPKAVIITTVVSSVAILILVGGVIFYGEKEPVVSVSDNSIQIESMYGLNIEFSEITGISIIEKSMSEIGIGTRTNGYSSGGETLKGNFKSDSVGKTLLFVQSKSSPTIKIERVNQRDVYISFRNSDKTEQLYYDMIATVSSK